MAATHQHALTIVAPVREDVRAGLAASLASLEKPVIDALRGVKSLHFARFVLLDGPEGPGSRLAFESNHDGDRGEHLDELAKVLEPYEVRLFGSWREYSSGERGELARFHSKHGHDAATYYLGHPGLSVARIHADDELRRHLTTLLDQADEAGEVDGKTAKEVRELLLSRLVVPGGASVGAVDRGLPAQPITKAAFWGLVAGVVVPGAAVVLPASLLVEAIEERSEPPRQLVAEGDRRLEPILSHEDRVQQNGLTHHVPLRPGLFRKTTLRLVLWFLERARSMVAYEGTLGGISSIHFARWVLLDDDTVLFFSNYDGSWESYLGDFVDKAHHYLTAVWSNTKWFPKSRGLAWKGATQESSFKQWTRTFQVRNQIWYSAYPSLTVSDVLENARLREGAVGLMDDEEEARRWLALL